MRINQNVRDTLPVSMLGSSAGLIALLTLSHLVTDAIASTFSALLPTIQYRLNLTETTLALLVATLSFSTSVTQPLFGLLADRIGQRRVGIAGMILNALLLSLIGVIPSVSFLFVVLLVGGLGSAAFHPAVASLARASVPSKKALAVSLFSAGGTAGLAVGPVLALFLISNQGPGAFVWFMLPAFILSLVLFLKTPDLERESVLVQPRNVDFRFVFGRVGLLAVSGILSGMAFVTFTNGISLWLVRVHGLARESSLIGWTLAAFSLSAALGGMIAGWLSRYVEQRVLISGSLLLALLPLFAIFSLEPGSFLFFLSVILAGASLNASLPIMIVKAQDLAPHAVATVSGLLMGFSVGVAGVLYIGVGHLQERLGLVPAMQISFLALIPAAFLAQIALKKNATKNVLARDVQPEKIQSCVLCG